MTEATEPGPDQVTRVGWVGLGKMGRPMAGHLADAGFALLVNDRDDAAVRAFLELHPGVRSSPLPELADESEIVITMLPNGRIVREVAIGPGGLLEHMTAGRLLLDMSSSAPHETVELAALATERGILVADAPVSGGVVRAQDGSLAIMVGGDDEAFERCRPLLEHMGTRIFRCGPVGSGHALKALNNLLSCIGMLAVGEVLAAGERFGIDPEVMLDTLNSSTGKNNATENKVRQFVFSGNHASGFALDLMAKDVDTAIDLAERVGVDSPLGRMCRELTAQALEELGPVDHTFLIDWAEGLVRGTADERRPL